MESDPAYPLTVSGRSGWAGAALSSSSVTKLPLDGEVSELCLPRSRCVTLGSPFSLGLSASTPSKIEGLGEMPLSSHTHPHP